MALSNALFAGLSGLAANQAKLNVVGNNIANANTVAFKSTRVEFKPQFYVTDSGGSQPNGNVGGTNPSQRGLGVVVSSLDRDFSPGSIETTGKSTDMAIDGGGFFIVRSDEEKYTRDGSFSLNPDNQLVTNSGDYVQGYAADQNFVLHTAQLSNLTIPLGTATTAQATSTTTLEGNLDGAGAIASGASILASTPITLTGGGGAPTDTSLLTDVADASDSSTPLFTQGDVITLHAKKGGRNLTDATFTVDAGSTLAGFAAFLRQGMGINDTVTSADPAVPQPGVTVEPDPADSNNALLVMAGNIGTENALSAAAGSITNQNGSSMLTFADGTNAAGIASNASGESVHTSFVAYDSRGTAVSIDVTAVLESSDNNGSTWRYFADSPTSVGTDLVVGSGTITFDNFGRYKSATGNTINIDRAGTGAKTPLPVTLDFSQMTSLSSRNSEMVMTAQDGSPIGQLTGFSVGTDGMITGNFSNGVTRTLGQLVMASFSNTQGLVDRGGNMFVAGANSGPVVRGAPGSLDMGKVVSGALELSNVDLSAEFINLIVASTGFSASSRVISTSDQLLTELLNSSR